MRTTPSARSWSISTAALAGLFREYAIGTPGLLDAAITELAGVDLCCWCPLDLPCHADTLIELIGLVQEAEAVLARLDDPGFDVGGEG